MLFTWQSVLCYGALGLGLKMGQIDISSPLQRRSSGSDKTRHREQGLKAAAKGLDSAVPLNSEA